MLWTMTQEPSGAEPGGDRDPGHDRGPDPVHQGDVGDQATGQAYGGYREGAYGEPVPYPAPPGEPRAGEPPVQPPYGAPPYGTPQYGTAPYGAAPYGPPPWDQGGYPSPEGPPPAGYPSYGYAPYGYPPPGYPPGAWGPPRPTNGMAIASLVLGILWIYWVGSILALVFGYLARRQIAERGESGGGLALAGIVLGWIGVGFLVFVGAAILIGVLRSP